MQLRNRYHLAQSESTGRRLRARRVTTTFVFALVPLGVAGTPSAAVETTEPLQMRERACTPQTIPLPGLTPTSLSTVVAMTDSGLVVGTSRENESPSTAVVWTSTDQARDTGVGGVVTENGSTISAWAVDVNEAGVVAIDRTTSTGDGRTLAEDAVVWSESSGAMVLPAPAFRPRAAVIAINDKGDVLGLVRGRGRGSVPVIWRDGKRSRLPVPPRGKAIPAAINNKGLVVGTFYGRYRDLGLWTWHSGSSPRVLASPEGGGAVSPTSTTLAGSSEAKVLAPETASGPSCGVAVMRFRVVRCALTRATCTTAGTWRPSSPGFAGSAQPHMWDTAATGASRHGYRPLPIRGHSVGATSTP